MCGASEGSWDLTEDTLAPREGVERIAEAGRAVLDELHRAVVGQDVMLETLFIAALCGGHVLLEGVPGTAKTLAVRAFAMVLGADFARVQFTPDLMPSDIIGTNVFDPRSVEFRLRRGPIFTNTLLADEVNRTPPKTQSALLEAMEERAVTIDGTRYPLPDPFLVCATQNPIEFEGTYPLPEAQVDRFMFKVVINYPEEAEEQEILSRYHDGFRAADLATSGIRQVLSGDDLKELRQILETVRVLPDVRAYIVRLCRAARTNRNVLLGPSPRGAIYLMLASRAHAALNGRDFTTPDDIKAMAMSVLRHRVILRPESEMEGVTPEQTVSTVLDTVPVPR